MRDTLGGLIKRDSVVLPPPFVSNAVRTISLNLAPSVQGRHVSIYSFAVDQAGRTGYSVKQGASLPDAVEALAFRDSALIVYGRCSV